MVGTPNPTIDTHMKKKRTVPSRTCARKRSFDNPFLRETQYGRYGTTIPTKAGNFYHRPSRPGIHKTILLLIATPEFVSSYLGTMVKITEKNKAIVIPVLSTTVLLAVLAFTEQQQHLHGLKDRTLQSLQAHEAFLGLASIMALSNMFGVPEKIVKEHWETSGFGNMFFPTKDLTDSQKRQLAGILEMLGILMAATDIPWKASLGYGLLVCMYSRGSWCQFRLGFVLKSGIVGVGALWAARYFQREFSNMLGNEEIPLPVVPLPDVSGSTPPNYSSLKFPLSHSLFPIPAQCHLAHEPEHVSVGRSSRFTVTAYVPTNCL